MRPAWVGVPRQTFHCAGVPLQEPVTYHFEPEAWAAVTHFESQALWRMRVLLSADTRLGVTEPDPAEDVGVLGLLAEAGGAVVVWEAGALPDAFGWEVPEAPDVPEEPGPEAPGLDVVPAVAPVAPPVAPEAPGVPGADPFAALPPTLPCAPDDCPATTDPCDPVAPLTSPFGPITPAPAPIVVGS
jgi:hypothetical protein